MGIIDSDEAQALLDEHDIFHVCDGHWTPGGNCQPARLAGTVIVLTKQLDIMRKFQRDLMDILPYSDSDTIASLVESAKHLSEKHMPVPICQIHGVPEPDMPGDFKACGECWHVWRTEAEFRADLAKTGLQPDDLSTAWTCPLCAHDF